MRKALLPMLAIFVGTCTSVSKEDVELIDAVIFALTEYEEGKITPKGTVSRKVVREGVEYRVSDDREWRLLGTAPKKCVIGFGGMGHTDTIDFNRVLRFEVKAGNLGSGSYLHVYLEGKQIYCSGTCYDRYPVEIFSWDSKKSIDEQTTLLSRYQRVVEFIKGRCPGLPY